MLIGFLNMIAKLIIKYNKRNVGLTITQKTNLISSILPQPING